MPAHLFKTPIIPTRALLCYLRVLAAIYFVRGLSRWAFLIGAGDARFDQAPVELQAATIYLAVIEVVAAVGLWSGGVWGVAAWLFAAVGETALYLGFPHLFATLWPIVAFHGVTILIYVGLAWWAGTPENTTEVFRLPPD